MSFVAAHSWVGVRSLVVGLASGRVSARSTASACHVVVPLSALTELVLELQRNIARCQALQMHVRNRLQRAPARMLLMFLRGKAGQSLLRRRLITVTKQTDSNLLPVVPRHLRSFRWLVHIQLDITVGCPVRTGDGSLPGLAHLVRPLPVVRHPSLILLHDEKILLQLYLLLFHQRLSFLLVLLYWALVHGLRPLVAVIVVKIDISDCRLNCLFDLICSASFHR